MDEKKINQLLSSAVKHGDIPVELTDSIVDSLLEHPPGPSADGITERVRAKLEIRMQDAAIAQAGQQITDRSLPFGRFLETVREKAGLTRTQIARRLGSMDADLQRLERGDVTPLAMAPHSFADVLVLFHLKLASATPMIVASIRVGPSLVKALTASSETLITGAKVRRDSGFTPDIVFFLGDVKPNPEHAASWRLSGNDFYGALAMEGVLQPQPWTAQWPVGAMVSAALAANEAFKFVMRQMSLRNPSDKVFFEPSRFCDWNFGPLPLPQEIVDFGQVDVISGGAISQACLYALMRFPEIQMRGRVFDNDLTGQSNLNRNMLTLASDIGSSKVKIISERCGSKLLLRPIANRFTGETSEVDKLAPRVLVGVDDIPSRWNVQRHAPGWITVSGTSHFSVSSSAHRAGSACCGCLHPVDDLAGANQVPTVSFVSFWAGLAMAARLFREVIGSPYSSDRQHVWLTPLRMDQPHAAMWLPVPPHRDCPVQCSASRAISDQNAVRHKAAAQ
jgi:transcriptional regulator with XRE-family HTH domain